MHIQQVMTPFWLVVWSCALALGWLVPNHYMPWTTFHTDVWISIVSLIAAIYISIRVRRIVPWHGISILVAIMAIIPLLQFQFGLINWSGTAWVAVAYLIGFLLLMLVGAQWESTSPYELADGMFLAIGIAAILSVGLQLHQWLHLDILDVWAIGAPSGRPFANLGQPNDLATLIVWSLLAVGWGVVRLRLGAISAILIAAYLLFGLALTGSRTAWIAILILVAASWIWRKLDSNRHWPLLVTVLAIYFAACFPIINWLGQVLFADTATIDFARTQGELRPILWAQFVEAVIKQPLFGFGWNQVASAQLMVALNYPALEMVASHSHNLFLDIILWCGVPVGLFFSILITRWLWRNLCAVKCVEDVFLILLLLVVMNHAMLELPLHHAYFLFPAGLVMGVLNVRLNRKIYCNAGRWSIYVLCLVSVIFVFSIFRDYLKVEASYLSLRYEWVGVRTNAPRNPPDVLLLNQLSEYIRYARIEPRSGMDENELRWMERVVLTYPNTGVINKYATSLALNNKPVDARHWLNRMCKVVPTSECVAVKKFWVDRSRIDPAMEAAKWGDV